jgi:hypothetical protein
MSSYTNETFQLHTTPMNQSEAQATCNAAGGHLASFRLLEEQAEVEQAYLDMVGGCLAGQQARLDSWLAHTFTASPSGRSDRGIP